MYTRCRLCVPRYALHLQPMHSSHTSLNPHWDSNGWISFCYFTNNEKIQYSFIGCALCVRKHTKSNVHIIHMHHQGGKDIRTHATATSQKKKHWNENRFLNFSTWNNNGKVNQSQANWFATLIRFFYCLSHPLSFRCMRISGIFWLEY